MYDAHVEVEGLPEIQGLPRSMKLSMVRRILYTNVRVTLHFGGDPVDEEWLEEVTLLLSDADTEIVVSR